MLTVLNKTDLPLALDTAKLPRILSTNIEISAKFGTGIGNLLKKITDMLDTAGFNLKQPVCFTARQKNLLAKLTKSKSSKQAQSIITKLLNGHLRV